MPERKPVMDNKIEIFKNEQFGEVRTILEGEKVLFCACLLYTSISGGRMSDKCPPFVRGGKSALFSSLAAR